MKFSIAILSLLIGILLKTECVQSKKSSGFLDTIEKAWEPFVRNSKANVYGAASTILIPMLEMSKKFMDSTGGEMVDRFVAGVANTTVAYQTNDIIAIHRRLNESQKFFQLIPQHYTNPLARKYATKYSHDFNGVVTCINQGKCGCQFFIYYLFDCVNPIKALFKS